MMALERRCRYCGKVFAPDRRVGARQKACSAECGRLRKKENNKAFGRANPGYWCGRYKTIKAWRAQHPDYQRQWRRRKAERHRMIPGEIQAELFAKVLDAVEENIVVLREIQAEIPLQSIDISRKSTASPARFA
jgi:hypothetical protein